MKIYPFSAADNYLSNQALEKGLDWIREIRDKAGNQMDICVDCWGRFDFPSAARIAKALEPYHIMYLEDAMLMNTPQAYARLAAETSVPICVSETLATRCCISARSTCARHCPTFSSWKATTGSTPTSFRIS